MPGARRTTRAPPTPRGGCFQYWFEEDHLLPSGEAFRFYFCQREAVETLVYLYEVEQRRDVAELVQAYFESPDLLELEILTSTKGTRSFRRYIPEIGKQAEQELPPAGLTRYAVKMATGSGKTVVMGLVIAWSLLHRRLEAGSAAADNFLVVAPNVIVYERLREDFTSARVFHQLPIVPPEWKNQFALQVTLRGDAREPASGGNLFLTNIQQIYEDSAPQAPINPVAVLLGNAPKGNLTTATPMLERVKRLPNLMVLNDEAHHVHDEDFAWNKTLMALHDNLKARGGGGLALWLDFFRHAQEPERHLFSLDRGGLPPGPGGGRPHRQDPAHHPPDRQAGPRPLRPQRGGRCLQRMDRHRRGALAQPREGLRGGE